MHVMCLKSIEIRFMSYRNCNVKLKTNFNSNFGYIYMVWFAEPRFRKWVCYLSMRLTLRCVRGLIAQPFLILRNKKIHCFQAVTISLILKFVYIYEKGSLDSEFLGLSLKYGPLIYYLLTKTEVERC